MGEDKNRLLILLRLPGCRVSYAIPCTAYITSGAVFGGKHYDMGAHPGLSCCLHNVRRAGHRTDFAGCIRKLVCAVRDDLTH